MVYPTNFEPTAAELIQFSSGGGVKVLKATPMFRPWRGEAPGDNYGGKTILDFAGEPVFAELAILRAFEAVGWEGVWVDSYGRCYRKSYWGESKNVSLPAAPANLLERICTVAEKGARCWDVFCWRGDQLYVFAEAKRRARDRIRESQRQWLAAALRVGLNPDAFLVVEWGLGEPMAAV